jgi:hypothetical protein
VLPPEASKEMAELATELEDLLRRMSREQLEQIVDRPLSGEPEAIVAAKRLAKMELARRQLH